MEAADSDVNREAGRRLFRDSPGGTESDEVPANLGIAFDLFGLHIPTRFALPHRSAQKPIAVLPHSKSVPGKGSSGFRVFSGGLARRLSRLRWRFLDRDRHFHHFP